MEMSVREARANFAHALDAAERGERVSITRNGKTIAELGPPNVSELPKTLGGLDWERMARVRKELGLDKVKLEEGWQDRFDDPAFSRAVMGLEDDRDPDRS